MTSASYEDIALYSIDETVKFYNNYERFQSVSLEYFFYSTYGTRIVNDVIGKMPSLNVDQIIRTKKISGFGSEIQKIFEEYCRDIIRDAKIFKQLVMKGNSYTKESIKAYRIHNLTRYDIVEPYNKEATANKDFITKLLQLEIGEQIKHQEGGYIEFWTDNVNEPEGTCCMIELCIPKNKKIFIKNNIIVFYDPIMKFIGKREKIVSKIGDNYINKKYYIFSMMLIY